MSKLSLCLGYFDSVHVGHRRLIAQCRRYADSHGLVSAVYTFTRDETGFFDSLYDFDSRRKLLEKAGTSMVIGDIFDQKLMNTSGEKFLDDLTRRLDVGALFCGHDYSFGRNAECGSDILAEYARRKGIYCYVMPPVSVGGQRVSTTRIKELLLRGEVEAANALLGQPYFMTGRVVHGRGVGRTFGFPTANLAFNGFLPKAGVYKCLAEADGKTYVAVTNVGAKPTFGVDEATVESMLVGFDGDLYDKQITLSFRKYMRPIYKFASGERLNEQILRDIEEASC